MLSKKIIISHYIFFRNSLVRLCHYEIMIMQPIIFFHLSKMSSFSFMLSKYIKDRVRGSALDSP